MDFISLLIGFVAGAVIALAAYIVIRRSILKGKRDEIIEKAEVEADKIKNERILQMVIVPYATIPGEEEPTEERVGGVGSTGL